MKKWNTCVLVIRVIRSVPVSLHLGIYNSEIFVQNFFVEHIIVTK